MLELWKPLYDLKDKKNPVVFDITGRKYKDVPINQFINSKVANNHPFVIFYNEKDNCYYYLKARGAWDYINNKFKPKFNNYELSVFEVAEGLFKKHTYVDCSQIFKCDKDLLESLIDVNSDYFKKTQKLSKNDQTDILNLIKEAVLEIPPEISLIEVKLNDNGETYGESLYLCDQKINQQFNNANLLGLDLEEDYENELLGYKSNKDSIRERERNRYQNGINFCLLFLNEYFPNKIKEFKNIQSINNNKNQNSKDLEDEEIDKKTTIEDSDLKF